MAGVDRANWADLSEAAPSPALEESQIHPEDLIDAGGEEAPSALDAAEEAAFGASANPCEEEIDSRLNALAFAGSDHQG